MRFLVILICCALQVLGTTSKIFPERLPQPCSKSLPDYNECASTFLKKLGPHLLKGIRELNFPKMDPLIIPSFTVNRTIQDLVSYSIILKNAQFWGFDTAQLESFKFDTENLNGELQMNIAYLHTSSEYDVSGKFLRNPFSLATSGYIKANLTNLDLFFKFSLKKFEKLGAKYYAFKDFKVNGTIEDGYIKVASKNFDDQPMADFVANFFNENPKRSFALIKTDYDESLEMYYKGLAENILDGVPAEELIPE